MPPLPLDERIVIIQCPKNLALRVGTPHATLQHPQQISARSCPPQPQLPQPHPCPSSSVAETLEHKCGSPLLRKAREERGVADTTGSSNTFSHKHSEASLGPGQHKRTHTIDIQLSLSREGGVVGSGTISDKGQKIAVSHSGSVKGNREKRLSLCLELGQGDRKREETLGKSGGAAEQLNNHPQDQNQSKVQCGSHHQNQLSVSPGGALGFVPAQDQYPELGNLRDGHSPRQSYLSRGTCPSQIQQEVPCIGNKDNSKLGPIYQPPNLHSLPRHHSSIPATHATAYNAHYPAGLPHLSSHTLPPPSFHQLTQPRPPRGREHPFLHLHDLPISPISHSLSRVGNFPSPDHTCTIDFSYPFSCGCWRLVRCRGGGSHSVGCQGANGSPSSSPTRPRGGVGGSGGRGLTSRIMGLRTLGGCLSTTSTPNTSSSNSVVSDCRAGFLRPLGCASCSGEAGGFESPAAFRKKLVGGCLPCTPLSSGPLRALQSCVGGCNPKASQTGSSTCSYCSSDPIVVTFNPRRGKPPGVGRGAGLHTAGEFPADDDDYSVRTIWPEELARKMTRSKTQPGPTGGGMGFGVRSTRVHQNQSNSNGTSPVILDCRNLLEFTRSQLMDHAGRRRLQQGKMAVLDFIGSGSSQDTGRDSLKRLWTKGEDMGDFNGLEDETSFPRSPSPRSPSPQSPPSFSPLSSAHTTLTKPKPRERERESGHSLPSAHSLHLVLNSLNRVQDEENGKVHLSLPLSSSLPASLSDESMMSPDIENATISPILPFLFLGNERDAQDLDLLLRFNIGFVVNVTTHLPLYHLDSGLVRYKRLPATDNSRQNLRQYFEEVFEFIEEAHQTGRGVLVHCQAGVSRSATIVIAYLMKHTLMTMMDAYKYVRGRRPVVSPNLNFMGQLLEFERDLNSGITPRILTPKLSGLETQV
ncbi:hypothetical protein AAFF_G00017420 [Aldrovandia affinis]|uniref:protein-tyrosine-phosphatase n=1 Tax=Aldrovandia affinis TaxID=143900 RepID=A0AAD7S5P3_9TELE|nr:hypothetical protein AAFF_G00017420 [Aldrovandia affinis]